MVTGLGIEAGLLGSVDPSTTSVLGIFGVVDDVSITLWLLDSGVDPSPRTVLSELSVVTDLGVDL